MDLMVDIRLIKDDSWFIINGVLLFFGGVDKSNPRAEVTIYEEGEPVDISDHLHLTSK